MKKSTAAALFLFNWVLWAMFTSPVVAAARKAEALTKFISMVLAESGRPLPAPVATRPVIPTSIRRFGTTENG